LGTRWNTKLVKTNIEMDKKNIKEQKCIFKSKAVQELTKSFSDEKRLQNLIS
jgi:hypothetical protein